MAYDIKLVQVENTSFGMSNSATIWPTIPFAYVTSSGWYCLTSNSGGSSSISTGALLSFNVQVSNGLSGPRCEVTLLNTGTMFYQGIFALPANTQWHIMMSANCNTQVVQVYCNDAPCAQLSGGFSSAGQMQNGGFSVVYVGSSFGNFPAIADLWEYAPVSFIDLSIVGNRRKFINADLTPVYLGANGNIPFGNIPPVFLTAPSSAAQLATNFGSGGPFTLQPGTVLAYQAALSCPVPYLPPPTPPPPPPPGPPPPPPPVVPNGVWVETLRPLFEVDDTLYDAWFVDGSDIPTSAQTIFNGTRFFGFNHQLGNIVSVWSGGLDCGDFLVQVGGFVDVPFGSAGGLYTAAYLDGLVAAGYDGVTNMVLLDGVTPIPAVVGKTYTSSGQIVRPASPADTGARNGPGQGKTRRNHMMTALLNGTQGISFGTDFQHVFPFQPALYVNGPAYPVTELYSGVYWATIDSTYDFDGMVCWTVGRPYPASVVNIGGFIQTQDR